MITDKGLYAAEQDELPGNNLTPADSPAALRLLAHVFSYVFHPVFIPLYVMYFLVFVHPSYAAGFDIRIKMQMMMIVALNAVFFPLFSVLLLKGLGFVQSIMLRTQKDRIIPYIASGIFFFWTWHVFRQQSQYHPIFASFFFGVLLTSSAALLANIYFKISMHAMGAGGAVGLFLVIMTYNSMLMTWPLSLALLIAGIVCTSRLILNGHTPKDIYLGFLAGVFCQLAAAYIML
ncbi:MAG: phosphatase PAP2 family protein [Ferruginibacter sp.]